MSTFDAELSAMWRRIYAQARAAAQQVLLEAFGQNLRGGKLSPSAIQGSSTTGQVLTSGSGGGVSWQNAPADPVFGASGSSHSAGDVPDPGSTAGTTRYLREDATWDMPPGGYSLPDATPTTTGGVEIDQNPPSGHPIALTLPDVDGPQGVAPLDPAAILPSAALPVPSGSIGESGRWTKSANNPILSPVATWESTAIGEPTVLVDGSQFVLFYGGGWSVGRFGRATCPLSADPTVPGNWTKYSGNPIIGGGAGGVSGDVFNNSVVKVRGTYYAYLANPVQGSGADLIVCTSSDGSTWAYRQVALAHNVQSGVDGWANTQVWYDAQANLWRMLVEAHMTSGAVWQIWYCTSTDGLSWTVQAGPLTGLQVGTGTYSGPWLPTPQKVNGLYQLWYHAATSGSLPTNIYRATSPDLATWTQIGEVLALAGTGFEIDQIADPSVIEYNGTTYLFYDGADNAHSASKIGVASFAGTLHELVSGAGLVPRMDSNTLILPANLPPATATTLGAVKVGAGLQVAMDGTLGETIYGPLVDSAQNLVFDSAGTLILAPR